MKTFFHPKVELYDGSQLASLFAYQRFGLLGDSVVSWIGPCDVRQHMVDAEDQRAGALIQGGLMLHFIVEVFDRPLALGVALQRIFASLIADSIRSSKVTAGFQFRREGDDLYVKKPNTDEGKWTISIATQSPTSTLVHFACNVTNTGTPVKTWAIEDAVGSAEAPACAEKFAIQWMASLAAEYNSILEATRKVHAVGSYKI